MLTTTPFRFDAARGEVTTIGEAVRGAQAWEQEIRFIKPSGEEVYLRAFSQPSQFQDETVYSGIVRDITKQKRAELALHKSHLELAMRLKFETLVSDLSAEFTFLAPSEVDDAIVRALDAVRHFFRTDRCGLLSVAQNRKLVYITHASNAEGVEPVSPDVNLTELFPWCYERLIIDGKPLLIAKLADLPPEAETDRQSFIVMGAHSNLSISLFVSRDAWYIITLQTLGEEREWHDEYVSRLRLLGEVFVNALERKKADEALRESEKRLRLGTDIMEVGIWTMNVDTGSVRVSDRMRDMFHFAVQEVVDYQKLLDAIHRDDRHKVDEAMQQSLHSGSNYNVDHRVVTPSGEIRWIAAHGRPEAAGSADAPEGELRGQAEQQ